MTRTLDDFAVLTFDCYGTLIDWESGIWDAYQPLIMANQRDDLTREVVLRAHSRHESSIQSDRPTARYPAVLSAVHGALASEFDLRTTDDLDLAFGSSLPHWPAFPDTADALRFLKTRYRLVILSNVDRVGFAASNRKLGVVFDAIYTAEDIGTYKPDPRNFEYLLEHLKIDLGLEPEDVLHTAQSLFHDHVPAVEKGLATAWIDRQRLSQGGSWGATAEVAKPPTTDFVFYSMGEMAAAVAAA